MIWLGVGIVVLGIVGYIGRHLLGGLIGLYRIVPVNEAHIRVLQNQKHIFSTRTQRTAYWVVPFLTKLHKLPLCNLAIPVNDIKLNDKHMAKFVCDIMCFININNLDLAVERLILTDTHHDLGFDFQRLGEDLRAIMESVGRTVTTKQSILEIYMNRAALDEAITKEVQAVFPKWGIELVDLELKDIKDAEGSTIIHDIEVKVASEIRRDAEVKVAQMTKESEVAKAESEEIYQKRQVERDQQVGIAKFQKEQALALAEQEANVKKVEAQRTLDVGRSEIAKQIVEQQAMATKLKLVTEAEGHSNEIEQVGNAEAKIIQVKKEADAAGTMKLAEALKQFNDAAINVKLIDTQKEILLGKYASLAQAIASADIKWVLTGDNAQKFFGLNLNGEGGANLQQFMEESGLTLDSLRTLMAKSKG